MTITVTTAEVTAILGVTALPTATITQNIATASAMLTSLFADVTITDELISVVTAWYTAHLCRITERELSEEDYSESEVAYYMSEGNFIKIAMELDTTGTLRDYIKALQNSRVSAVEIGF